jgi:hypothetical protein
MHQLSTLPQVPLQVDEKVMPLLAQLELVQVEGVVPMEE